MGGVGEEAVVAGGRVKLGHLAVDDVPVALVTAWLLDDLGPLLLRDAYRLDGLGLGLRRGGLLCLRLLGRCGFTGGLVALAAVSVTVTVASGAAVVPASSEPPTIAPTASATTDAMIRVGQPNRFGFFGCS
jgi:hypothetical protein